MLYKSLFILELYLLWTQILKQASSTANTALTYSLPNWTESPFLPIPQRCLIPICPSLSLGRSKKTSGDALGPFLHRNFQLFSASMPWSLLSKTTGLTQFQKHKSGTSMWACRFWSTFRRARKPWTGKWESMASSSNQITREGTIRPHICRRLRQSIAGAGNKLWSIWLKKPVFTANLTR